MKTSNKLQLLARALKLSSVSLTIILFAFLAHPTKTFASTKSPSKSVRALDSEWFPSRLHAFVFKNWTCVKKDVLAKTLKADVADIERIATELGLPSQGKISPEFRGSRGYITVLRRNWHILPNSQILDLLGISQEELDLRLKEDDFLLVKLGGFKPECEILKYEKSSPEILKKCEEFRRAISPMNSAEIFKGEERFAFVDKINSYKLKSETQTSSSEDKSPFELRLIYPYLSSFGDPLMEDGVPAYSEGMLNMLADSGINAVWLHTALSMLSEPDEKDIFPGSFDAKKRLKNLKVLTNRAQSKGIKVFIYINELRGESPEFFEKSPERLALRGSYDKSSNHYAFCTSQSAVNARLKKCVKNVFDEVPNLGGAFAIVMSENLTHCLSRGNKNCPACNKRGESEVIANVCQTIFDGINESAAKEAKFILWDWAWSEKNDDVLARLPKNSIYMTVSEWSLPISRGGVSSKVGEYSISAVGPSENAVRRWKIAKENGLKCMAKIQANTSWELATVPYLPVMNLVARHAKNLYSQNLYGLMFSWSLGGHPSENLELYKNFNPTLNEKENLMLLAQKCYGKAAAEKVVKAWETMSNAFEEFPFGLRTLYKGPQHMGVANPIYLHPTGYSPSMVGFPYDGAKSWSKPYGMKIWAEQMGKVAEGFFKGEALLGEALELCEENAREKLEDSARFAKVAAIQFKSSQNQTEFYRLRDESTKTAKSKRSEKIEHMSKILREELALCEPLLKDMRKDSRIGFESSCNYFFLPADLYEKQANLIWALKELEKEKHVIESN